MLASKSIRDVMIDINSYPHIPSDISIKQAINIVRSSMIHGRNCYQPLIALVFDERGMVGTLRLRDILKGLEPAYLRPSSNMQGYQNDAAGLAIIWDSLFKSESLELAEHPVSEAMNPITVYVSPEDAIVKAAYLMIHNDLLILPVLEDGKKVRGLIRMAEVFEVLADTVLED